MLPSALRCHHRVRTARRTNVDKCRVVKDAKHLKRRDRDKNPQWIGRAWDGGVKGGGVWNAILISPVRDNPFYRA